MKLNYSLSFTTLAAALALGLTFTTGCAVSSDGEEPDRQSSEDTDESEQGESDGDGDSSTQDYEDDDTAPCSGANCEVPVEDDPPLEGTPCEVGIEARLIQQPETPSCSECVCGQDGLIHCSAIDGCVPEQCQGDECCQDSARPAVVCETGWTCEDNQWNCSDSSECPVVEKAPNTACAAVITQVQNPQTGTCCTYSDGCGAPEGWEPCGNATSN